MIEFGGENPKILDLPPPHQPPPCANAESADVPLAFQMGPFLHHGGGNYIFVPLFVGVLGGGGEKKVFFWSWGRGTPATNWGIFFAQATSLPTRKLLKLFFRKCVFLLLFKVIFLQMSTSTKKLLLFLTSSSALWHFFGSDGSPDVESGKKKDLLWFRDSFFLGGKSRCARRRRLNLSFFVPRRVPFTTRQKKCRFLFLFYFCVYSCFASCLGNGCAFYCSRKKEAASLWKGGGGNGPVSHARM